MKLKMKIQKDEHELIGMWIINKGNVIEDSVCARINVLITDYLNKLAVSQSGWEVLYEDTEDGRLWELTYRNSEYHGGGPPSLININEEEARKKYSLFLL